MNGAGIVDVRLRVAQVTQWLEMGGLEQLLVEMARHRDTSRFDWTVISLGSSGPLVAPLEELGVRVITLNEPSGFRTRLWHRLWRLFRDERFDVVHTHDEGPLIYAMPAAWWANVPRRIHTRHHGKLEGETWRRTLLLRQASRFVQDYVCVSQDSGRDIKEHKLVVGRTQTLWNGIDLTRFAYQGPCANGPVVTVARLRPEKDVANLLRAVPHVVANIPRARFEIAGYGQCHDELIQLAHNLGITEYVTFLGAVRDIPALLERARLFVLPSQTEGISLTLLEAMARGVPVVATNVGGNPEVVSQDCGILVPSRDPAALAEAIAQLWNDPEASAKIGLAGRCRVEAHFDIRKMVAAYEGLYFREASRDKCTAEYFSAPVVSHN